MHLQLYPRVLRHIKQDMRLIGMLTAGMYIDDCLNVQENIIQEYYGVTHAETSRTQQRSGAGHGADDDPSSSEDSHTSDISMSNELSSGSQSDTPSDWNGIEDEDQSSVSSDSSSDLDTDFASSESGADSEMDSDEEWNEMVADLGDTEEGPIEGTEEMQQRVIDGIIHDTESNFLHEAVHVSKYPDPLRRYPLAIQEAFNEALEEVLEGKHDPPRHFGLYPDEWDNEGYPPYEFIKSGRRGANRELRIELPDATWRPRAELWGKAVCMLDDVCAHYESVDSDNDVNMSSESTSS